MYDMPTQEQIDGIMRRAQIERSRAMRDGVHWIGRQIAAPFRTVFLKPTEHRN